MKKIKKKLEEIIISEREREREGKGEGGGERRRDRGERRCLPLARDIRSNVTTTARSSDLKDVQWKDYNRGEPRQLTSERAKRLLNCYFASRFILSLNPSDATQTAHVVLRALNACICTSRKRNKPIACSFFFVIAGYVNATRWSWDLRTSKGSGVLQTFVSDNRRNIIWLTSLEIRYMPFRNACPIPRLPIL